MRFLKRLFRHSWIGARCVACFSHNTERISWRWLKASGNGWTEQHRQAGFVMWRCHQCGILQNRKGLDKDSRQIAEPIEIHAGRILHLKPDADMGPLINLSEVREPKSQQD